MGWQGGRGCQHLGMHGEGSAEEWGKMWWFWLTGTLKYGQGGGKTVKLEQKEVLFQIFSNTAKAGKPALGSTLYVIQCEH